MAPSVFSAPSSVGETLTPGAAAPPRETPSNQPPSSAVAAALAQRPPPGPMAASAVMTLRTGQPPSLRTALMRQKRRGGDLVGEDQAGHVKIIGATLCQRLLTQAVSVARGDAQPPNLVIGQSGSIPPDYVPDAIVRIGLYGRLARIDDAAAIDAFEEELEDRFGPPPEDVGLLLATARLLALARAARVAEARAGPKAVVFATDPRAATKAGKRLSRIASDVTVEGVRIAVPAPRSEGERRAPIERLLSALADAR